MNITSNAKDPFLAALTNPTELAKRKGNLKRSYPVVDKNGRRWADSEAAYKAFKIGDTLRDERIMERIIAAKLTQHPELAQGIKERGGVAWLYRCSHVVGVRNSRWEGEGKDSRFIRCLVKAFKEVMASPL
jgi:hypothetical protein